MNLDLGVYFRLLLPARPGPHDLVPLTALGTDLSLPGAGRAHGVISVHHVLLLALGALRRDTERLVLLVLDLPLYDLLAALAHVRHLDAVDKLRPARRVVQIVLESGVILMLLCPRPAGVPPLTTHASNVAMLKKQKFTITIRCDK